MQKIEGDIKKRWLLLALANMLILLVVYGALMLGFGFFAVNADRRMSEREMISFADTLKGYSLDRLKDLASGEYLAEAQNPNCSFGLYVGRGDSSFELFTSDLFLKNNSPNIGGEVGAVTEESIGGHKFLTYTAAINGAQGSYIKVFTPYDASSSANKYVSEYGVIFAVAFVVLGVIISLVWGYIEIKPVMAGYYKQKSFINDMSHEIRTPLAIIKGNLENVSALPDAKISDVQDTLDSCLKEVDYMTDISSGLLNIVRGESKNGKKNGNLSDAVSEIIDMYSDVVSMSGKALVANIEQCDMQVDRDKIKQLVTILVENSIKYTREGDRINVKLKNSKDGCILTVADTGIGVGKNELELIFDRFYRGENAKEIQGTGLGLSIAKSIAESMDGSIKAIRNVPCGLEIIVQLKRA